jgi:acyl dehydratase
MNANLSSDKVDVGDEITPLTKQPDKDQVVAYMSIQGLSGDGRFANRFTDAEEAKAMGLRGPIVPGNLSMGFLSQMLTDWAGAGSLRRLEVTYRGFVNHGDTLTCQGIVTEKHYTEDGVALECDVFIENQRGERAVSGTAFIVLPDD